MEEDDMDFTPSPNTSSNLASLFGFNKKPLQGNPSLTYTAPKAPKRESSPGKKQSSEEKGIKSIIIISKAVQAYKLENQAYTSQGLTGLVISGVHDSKLYEIILYKPSKEHICKCRISNNFLLTISPNNYVSFYDNNKQNWSIMFQSVGDLEQFAVKVAICKFYCHSDSSKKIIVQDLTPPLHNAVVDSSSTVNISYSSYSLTPDKSSKIKEDVKEIVKLSECSFVPLTKGLVGCTEKSKRIVIAPFSLGASWLKEEQENFDLLLEVKIEGIILQTISKLEPKLSDDGFESPVDSSAEESSIKARGASLKEALSTTKTQKANLISRMARMGQATLPVKQGLSGGPSDSEEEAVITSSPKARTPRNRSSTAVNQNILAQGPQQPDAQSIALYQNDLTSWQQSQLTKVGVAYQQLIPLSASPITSPTTDPNFSAYVSESRVQAAELRMGISKVSEKLDLVWNKLQNLNLSSTEMKSSSSALMDSTGILNSIQSLIAENESLKVKIEEQKGKIEQQNDRIFQLLELNHKYLEQNSNSHEKQSVNEIKLKAELDSLLKKEIHFEENAKIAQEKIQNLEHNLEKAEKINKELTQKIEELNKDLKGHSDEKKKEIENMEEKMGKAVDAIGKYKDRLREVVTENENLKSVIEDQRVEIETGKAVMNDSKIKNEEYKMKMEGLKKQISIEEVKSESKIEELTKKVEVLEEQNKNFRKLIEEKENNTKLQESILKVISKLKEKFLDETMYTGLVILHNIEQCVEEVTGVSIPDKTMPKEKPKTESFKPNVVDNNNKLTVVPAPRTTINNNEGKKSEQEVEKIEKNSKELINEKEKKEEEKNKVESPSEKTESDSRYKSYYQGWRTSKPPPPPLFDDEDDEVDEDDWLN